MAWRPSCWRRTAVSLWVRDGADRLVGQRRGHRRAGPTRALLRACTGQGDADVSVGPLARQRALRATGHPYAATERTDSSLGADVTAMRTSRPATPSRTPWRTTGCGSETGRGRTSEANTAKPGAVAWSTTTSPSASRRVQTWGAGRAMWVPTRGGVTRGRTSESDDRSDAPRRQPATRSIPHGSATLPCRAHAAGACGAEH